MLVVLGLAVVDPENPFGGGGGGSLWYVVEGHHHPLMDSWGGLLYITIGWGGVHYWLLDFSRSTTFISSMKLKHLMVMKDVRWQELFMLYIFMPYILKKD